MISGHVFMATSLDGFIARRDHALDWLTERTTPEEDHGYEAFIDTVDGVIMGRATFKTVLGLGAWPYAIPVIVASSTLTEDDIPPELSAKVKLTQLAPRQLMQSLSDAGWTRAYVDGGRLVQSFLRAGLISEFTLTMLPVLLGDGRRLFGETESDIDLELLEAKSFRTGLVQLHYRVA